MTSAEIAEQRQQMAALLRRKIDKILEDWENAVRANVSGDQTLSKSLLHNSLHALLENLANALEDQRWNYHVGKNTEIALKHAQQRYQINIHELDQIIDEYAELRKAVVRNIASQAYCTTRGVEVIHEFIDASIKHASRFFTGMRRQDDKNAFNEELTHTQSQRDGYEEERDSSRGHAQDLEQERQLRSEVISMLGHDMRTPLTGALLAAQMLAKKPENIEEKARRLNRVIQGLERLDTMIQNLLDADRLRTGQLHPIQVEVGNLTDIVDKVCRELNAIHGARFVADAPNPTPGYWDCTALRRVLENLGNNAVKYGSPTEPVLLQLSTQNEQIELSVHNEGEPIAALALSSLFEPHFRTDEAERSEKTGWGLGLAFVKAVAEAHGGTASVDSISGRGTTFYLRFPVDCRKVKKRLDGSD